MYAHMLAQKRKVSVTLDVECYDDLDLESFDWNDILSLEGDENVNITIREQEVNWQCANSFSGTVNEHSAQIRVLQSQLRNSPMDDFTFDTDIFAEINDMEGEIFDIPEMQDEKKFDVEGYINGNIDY